MKTLSHKFITILIGVACFALVPPNTFGVVPPPDGGYPNFTTAEGQNALKNLTIGSGNTGVGWYSLFSDTEGGFNTATGAGALLFNNGDANTAVGTATLLFNATGTDNTAVGTTALLNNTATGNTAFGSQALFNNTTGGMLGNIQGIDVGPNVAVGWQALESNTIASANTAMGYQALHSFTSGPVGFEQLGLCTAVGFQALANATGDAYGNSAFGYQALYNSTGGGANTAIGDQALFNNSTGTTNVAGGIYALFNNASGSGNTAIGGSALTGNTDGSNNIGIGFGALGANTTGDGNIGVGYYAASSVSTANNVICIGAHGLNVSDSCYIGHIFGASSPGGMGVFVNSDGKLGTTVSSRRFKEEIKPMDKASEALLALQPVTFRYKKEFDPTSTAQFGLVAEEVEKVNPDLVVRDKEGKAYSVRYDQVNAMLLNEFLKEHATVQELKSQIAAVTATVKQQAGQIQKVSAQVEVGRHARRVASKRD